MYVCANACVSHPCGLWVEVIKLLVNNHLVDGLVYSVCLSVGLSVYLLYHHLSIYILYLSIYPSVCLSKDEKPTTHTLLHHSFNVATPA